MKTMNGNRALSEMSFMENLIAVIVEKVQLIVKDGLDPCCHQRLSFQSHSIRAPSASR